MLVFSAAAEDVGPWETAYFREPLLGGRYRGGRISSIPCFEWCAVKLYVRFSMVVSLTVFSGKMLKLRNLDLGLRCLIDD